MNQHSTRRAGVSKSFEKLRFEQQRGTCFWCSLPLATDYQVDHIIPVAKGGVHSEANSVLSHGTCNRRKRDTLPWDYVGATEWNVMLSVLDGHTDGVFSQVLRVWERLPEDVKSGVLYAVRDKGQVTRKVGSYGFELPLEAADYMDKLARDQSLGRSLGSAIKAQLMREPENRFDILEINGSAIKWSDLQDALSWELSNAEDASCISFYLYHDGPITRDFAEVVHRGFARIWEHLDEATP